MKKILGLVGASGKMGRVVQSALAQDKTWQLGAAIVSAGSASLDQSCAQQTDLVYQNDLVSAAKGVEAWLDFSNPGASLAAAKVASELGTPILIGTSGHSPSEMQRLRDYSKNCALLFAPNTSLGIFALRKLSVLAKQILPGFDVEISELHHRYKKDAPSGTALAIASDLIAASDQESEPQIRPDRAAKAGLRNRAEIGITSLRGGDMNADHTIFFLGDGERLEITHRVRDRVTFALGALELLSRLVNQSPGWYQVEDLLG